MDAPSFDDIRAAERRIQGHLLATPLLEHDLLNQRVGGRLLLKAEGLQRTGSFKARGAWNRVAALSSAERARGVVAFSSGNHGQAVAWSANRQGAGTAIVVMPADAPPAKIERTRAWGAEVVLYDRTTEDREAIGRRLADEHGLTLVPPYEDPHVIAGQGTLAVEAVGQAEAIGVRPDLLLVCCSGGGLAAGCALALEALLPDARVWACEPEGHDDTARSLQAGHRVENPPGIRSICDAVLSTTPGELTFAINRPRLGGVAVASDAEALDAMRTAFETFRVVAEPGGALALAAVLAGHVKLEGRTAVVAITGANVDPAIFRRAIAEAA